MPKDMYKEDGKMDLRLTTHCRFPQLTPPERTANTVSLFSFLFEVPLRLALPWTKGGVCFLASDFVLED